MASESIFSTASRYTGANLAEPWLRAHPPTQCNLLPREGQGRPEEGSPFLCQGLGTLCSASRKRASLRPLDHRHPSCSLPAPLGSACSLHEVSPTDTGTWDVLAAPAPSQLLYDSSTPGENQDLSTHQMKDLEKHFMGKGTRRMLLACLITASRPWVSASWLPVGNGTCFPSRCTVTLVHHQWKIRRVQLCSCMKPYCIHTTGMRCRSGPPNLQRDLFEPG